MAEKVRVWVKTSVIEQIVYGKVRSSSKRQGIPDDHATVVTEAQSNWGWARAELVREGAPSAAAGASSSNNNGIGAGDQPVKVCIRDEDSAHDRKIIEIGPDAAREGVVMDNVFGSGDDEDEEESDDEYGDGGGGGGGSSGPPDDLIHLTHLHEPAVVYCLRRRYARDKIYTATGPILIALNPFKNCKSLYSDSIMKKYSSAGARKAITGQQSSDDVCDEGEGHLPPHVYSVADHSFRSMMRMFEDGNDRKGPGEKGFDQSILVSGESGAGKTVTTKFIMKYLASLSEMGHKRKDENEGNSDAGTEKQVLQSNPILESFGNARTVRNDNSSRFGKFIELEFTCSSSLIGASIETYLLEKVRLVTQTPGERNYHIFYEILAGMEEEELERYYIGPDTTAEDFTMTNASGTFDRRDGVEDSDTYWDLKEAMNTMGFTAEEQDNIMTVTCALLHSSNVDFSSLSADESAVNKDNPSLEPVLSLMGVSYEAFNQALCYFSIQAGKEKHTRSIPKEKAEKGMEALIKATYGALFNFIVRRINSCITVKESTSRRGSSSRGGSSKKGKIGVLDIFGFESFKKNSFEQLCINYCNEALQQQFNLFVLKNEQEEYEREVGPQKFLDMVGRCLWPNKVKVPLNAPWLCTQLDYFAARIIFDRIKGIQWSFISFPENQDVLDLIWKKGAGILNILDDQCKAPGTTDKTFATDIYQKLTGHSRFEADFRQVGARCFGVFHYAGSVEYDTEGFVEKNRDELPREATDLLMSSSNAFVKGLAEMISGEQSGAPPPPPSGGRPRRAAPVNRGGSRGQANARTTVGAQFSSQLQELRRKIDLTSPHYVRCLKPNDLLVPDHFDPVIIADQLRCAGVVEAVRVSRVGYPQRYTHANFVKRYRILGLKELKKAKSSTRRQKPCDVLVRAIAKQIQSVQNSDQNAVEETAGKKGSSNDEIDLLSVGIQIGKTKVFLRRKAYEIMEQLRSHKTDLAAIQMQLTARRFIAQRSYLRMLSATVSLQCATRQTLAKKEVHVLRIHYSATVIQRSWRKYVARRMFVAVTLMARWVQRFQRGRIGRARFDCLNRERKSTEIQASWRRHASSCSYQQKRRNALLLQCLLRRCQARKALKELKAHAKNLDAVAEERDELKKEMQRLREAAKAAERRAKEESERAASVVAACEAEKESAALPTELDELRKETEEARDETAKIMSRVEKESERAANAEESLRAALEDAEKDKEKSKQMLLELEEAKDNLAKERERVNNMEKTVDALRLEVKSLKDASSNSDDHAKALQKEIQMLQKELEHLRNETREASELPSPPITRTVSEEESEKLQLETEALRKELEDARELHDRNQRDADLKLQMAENEVEKLREELDSVTERGQELSSRLPANSPTPISPTQPTQSFSPSVPMGDSAAEIEYLRSEVMRLEDEVKNSNTVNADPNSPENLHARYDELRRLSEAAMEKDREIEALRKEVLLLQEEKAKLLQPEPLPPPNDDASSLGFEDVTSPTKDPFITIARKKSHQGQGDENEDSSALKAVNKMLREELETLQKELDECKKAAKEEAEQAAKDLEAFAETLKGVDEMRRAAESMSRELSRMRRRNRFGGGESDRLSMRDDVSMMSGGTELYKEAAKILDKSNSQEHQAQHLWAKVRSTILMNPGREGQNDREQNGGN